MLVYPLSPESDTNQRAYPNIETSSNHLSLPVLPPRHSESGNCGLKGQQLNNDLYRLVKFQTVFGVTYLGKYFCHCDQHYEYKCIRRFLIMLLIIYDIVCVLSMLFLQYHAFSDYIYVNLFQHSSKKLTMSIIFRSAGYCFLFEYVAIKVTTTFRGLTIITIINDIGNEIRLNKANVKFYYFIFAVVCFISFFHSIAFILIFTPLYQDSHLHMKLTLWSFYLFGGLLYGINKSSMCAFHLYTSILICQRVSEFKASLMKYSNYGLLLEEMLQLKHKLLDLNNQMSLAMLVKILTNGVLLSSCVCSLEDKLHDDKFDIGSMLALLSFFIAQLMDQAMSCYASQMIIDTMECLVRSIQELTAKQCTELLHLACVPRPTTQQQLTQRDTQSENVAGENVPCSKRRIEDIEHRCLQHICAMKNSMCFNVMNMFDLRSMTVLMILSNVCNYAVLLIQTK